MTSPHPHPDPATVTGRAAGLLEAVARQTDTGADAAVAIHCGAAADLLRAGHPEQVPALPPPLADQPAELVAAVDAAVTLLAELPPAQISDPILDALLHAREAQYQAYAEPAGGPARVGGW